VTRGRSRSVVASLALAVLFALAGADAARAQGAEGRRYTPGAFDAVVISGSATVRLVQGREDSVFVEGDDEAQGAVSLDVEDGVLRVRPGGAWKFWRSKQLQMTITARDLRQLQISGAADVAAAEALRVRQLAVRISGAGSVRLDKLKAERLEFTVSGLGSGQMAGVVDELVVRISGRGSYLGENLASQQATLVVSGAGDVKVWATKELTASVSGVASVDFWGPARVTRSSSGLTTWNERGDKRVP
jgi:hypothetical protein